MHAGTQLLIIQCLTKPVPGFDARAEAIAQARADGRAAADADSAPRCPYGPVRYLNPMSEPDLLVQNWQIGFLVGRSEQR